MKFKILIVAFACALFIGCGQKQIQGLAPDQIPTAIAKAFEKSDAGIRMQAEMIATAVKGNQWLAATTALNELLAFPNLSAEQRRVLSQTQITVGERMRDMAAEATPDAPKPTARKSGEAPAPPATPEEAAAAATALRIYSQSK